MSSVSHILILAAGLGRRFQASNDDKPSAVHKALVGLWDERGTLQLLLEHLLAIGHPPSHITVATGYQTTAVQATIKRIQRQIRWLPPHADFIERSMMETLFSSFQQLPKGNTWVLFADTLYTRAALETICAHRGHIAAITCIKRQPGTTAKEVGVTVKQGRVCQFWPAGTDGVEHDITHFMAHAVFWPANCLPHNRELNCLPLKQWQILAASDEPVQAIELAEFAATDMDTQSDAEELRPHVTTKVLQYFANNLDKDRRNSSRSDYLSNQHYVKICESRQAAAHEAMILKLLHQQLPGHTPQFCELQDNRLVMTAVRGIRLYDVLRQLTLEQQHISDILMTRCNQRLLQQQQVMIAANQNGKITTTPYPFADQVTALLACLCDLLRLAPPPQHELQQLQQQWQESCVVPFRDATPKNIIILDPELCPTLPAAIRQQRLQQRLHGDSDYWRKVSIVDVDFTSTKHLTSSCDDHLSLNGHAVHLHANAGLPTANVNPLTLLVRYLRFGGRKLAYKLINPIGYRQRFRYDNPQFYFRTLVNQLGPILQSSYPELISCLSAICNRAERWHEVMPSMQAPNYSLHALPYYWQESPLELTQQHALLKLIVRRPFRRSQADNATQADIIGKLSQSLRDQQPIKFSVPFGGYKHPQLPHSPAINLAETFWLNYLRSYAEPMVALYPAGVTFSFTYMSGVIEAINGISRADQATYLNQLAQLCQQLSCSQIRFELVDIADLMGGTEQATATLWKRYRLLEAAGTEPVAKALASAERNLVDSEQQSPRTSALLCEAMESIPERRNFNKFGSHIQLSHQKASLSVHIGSCQTSVVQPWVGFGCYDSNGKPRIISVRQWQQR